MIIFSHHSQILTALPVCSSVCFSAFSGVSSHFKPSSISADTAEQQSWAVHPLPEAALSHTCSQVPLGLTESPVYPDAILFDFIVFHMGPFLTASQFPCLEDHIIASKWHDLQGIQACLNVESWCYVMCTPNHRHHMGHISSREDELTKCSWLPLFLCVGGLMFRSGSV